MSHSRAIARLYVATSQRSRGALVRCRRHGRLEECVFLAEAQFLEPSPTSEHEFGHRLNPSLEFGGLATGDCAHG
jgi:hypothetical protein